MTPHELGCAPAPDQLPPWQCVVYGPPGRTEYARLSDAIGRATPGDTIRTILVSRAETVSVEVPTRVTHWMFNARLACEGEVGPSDVITTCPTDPITCPGCLAVVTEVRA